MKFYATPLSHFSRKVRILLDFYSIPYNEIDVGNVAEASLESFAHNPLMRVPVLEDDKNWIIESDLIAAYLVEKFDPSDRLNVNTRALTDLNARAVMNGMMAEEVNVIVASRTGVPVGDYRYFSDSLDVLRQGLSWLESQSKLFTPLNPTYREIHLVTVWQHIEYFNLVSLEYPKLKSAISDILTFEYIHKSAPDILRPKSK